MGVLVVVLRAREVKERRKKRKRRKIPAPTRNCMVGRDLRAMFLTLLAAARMNKGEML